MEEGRKEGKRIGRAEVGREREVRRREGEEKIIETGI